MHTAQDSHGFGRGWAPKIDLTHTDPERLQVTTPTPRKISKDGVSIVHRMPELDMWPRA